MLRSITSALYLLSIAAFGIFIQTGPACAQDGKRVALDKAQVQRTNPNIATRVLEVGTKINLHFGDTVIPGTLNDSETAQALIKMLPYTVKVNRYPSGVLFCRETIERRKWYEPDHFYLKMPTGPDRKAGGLFAVCFARGDIGLSRSDEQYNRIMDFIGKNKLTVDGDCYEEYPLNELSTPNPSDYLVKIAIKCRP